MHFTPIMPMVLAGLVVGASLASAEVLNTHRIPALLALEAAGESVGVCAKQGYLETAVVVDADGATIVRCVATEPVYTPSIVAMITPTLASASRTIRLL